MKKILMIAVAALAVASQAASVAWQLSATKAEGYAAGQSVLFFVGAADETFTYGDATNLTLSDYVATLLADGVDKATEAAFDTATTISGRSGITTAEKSKAISYDAGTSLAAMIIVLDGSGKYSGFSLSGTVAGAGDTSLNTAMPSASNTTQGFADLPGSGDDPGPGPVDPVPEPATGALALAGVALLFRRRRA